jgi:hypothetical protein
MKQSDDQYLKHLKARYRKASKKEKGAILDEYVKTTGHNRKYASTVLSGRRTKASRPIRRPRRVIYGSEVREALLICSDLFDGINSRRLRAAMDMELIGLYNAGRLQVSPDCYRRLQTISAATIGRLLLGHRVLLRKARGFTKPGTLLKDQIAIRTWFQWDENCPGFCEMDLVDHCGGRIIRGADNAWTLCFTDVNTSWTECIGVRNKAQVFVFEAICRARERLPFPLLGVDSDNGSEFINDQLVRYCTREHITFTRARAGRRNDSAFVEQKNWSVVRRAVGYIRIDTPEQLQVLNRLYAVLHYYSNFFLPVAKLADSVRHGAKVTRWYDKPQTPYARVLASPHVSDAHKADLRETYASLSLVDLRCQYRQLQDELAALQPCR